MKITSDCDCRQKRRDVSNCQSLNKGLSEGVSTFIIQRKMAAPEPLDCGATRPFPVLSLLGVPYTLLKTSLCVPNTQNNCRCLIDTPPVPWTLWI